MKRFISFCIVITLIFTICSCGTSKKASIDNDVKNDEPLNLAGEWIQPDISSETYQKAIIADNTIEIYWVNDEEKSESLYWAGSYEKPTSNVKKYSWDSINNKEKTDTALLASPDDTKTFTFKNGILSYQVSALGTTKTVELKKKNK